MKDETLGSTLGKLAGLALVFFVAATGARGSEEGGGRAAFWIDLALGEPVSVEEMLEDLGAVDVVYLGETHRLKRHHRLQLEIVRGLAATGRPLVAGFEQIEARDQGALDEYNAGKIDFEALAEAIEWKKQWNNYEDYRPVLEAVREAGGRVVGLNGPREVIRAVGSKGLAGLSEEERAQLPADIFLDDPIYEQLMEKLLLVHATMEKGMLRKVFEAQAARDEAMAAALVAAAEMAESEVAEEAAERKPLAVMICGAGHCQFGLGTPDRVRRRLKGARDRIVLMSESGDLVLTDAEKAMMREIEIRHADVEFIRRPLADYLHAKEQAPE